MKVDAKTAVFDIDCSNARVVHFDATVTLRISRRLQGHSIGRWEGDTLVVDTVGFLPHEEGIGFGLPSSGRKHLVERFKLDADRRHLDYDVTVEDPAYLKEAVHHSVQWEYSPDLEPSGVKCDLEIARRYLRD